MTWIRFWRFSISGLVAAEILAVRSKDPCAPLSHCGRRTMRLDTRPGQVLLVVGWGALTAWLLPHLLRQTSSLSFTLDS